jgi:hypothetical protein
MPDPILSKDRTRALIEAPMGGYWIAYRGKCVPVDVDEKGDGEHRFEGANVGLFINRNDDARAWLGGSDDEKHAPVVPTVEEVKDA